MSISEEYMSAHDVALKLNIDRSYILALCRKGRFDGAEKIGNYWVIPRVSVENFKRLPPGVKSKTKQQQKEDKALIAEALEATNSAPNENIARSEER